MNDRDELAEGRARRGRVLVTGILGIALLGSLPFLLRSLEPHGRPIAPDATEGPPAGIPTPSPSGRSAGRLVYVADEPGRPDLKRLWILDLGTGALAEGPGFHTTGGPYELRGAGPRGEWPLLIRHGSESVALLFEELAADAVPIELARAPLISAAPDGGSLLVGGDGDGRARCPPTYGLSMVDVLTRAETPIPRDALPCGRLLAATLYASRTPVVTVLRGGIPHVVMLRDDGPDELFRGVAARWSAGASLLPDRDAHLLVWPGGGALRPLVTGARLSGSVVAASADGRSVAVDGRIAGDGGLWLVDVAAGTARRLRLRNDPPLSVLSAATFDADGRLYAAGPARIVVRRGTALLPVRLPRGAPAPVGPLAWIP